MSARVLSITGNADGMRFGDLRYLDGQIRHYAFDRLTGSFRIYCENRVDGAPGKEDKGKQRREEAREALMRHIGVVAS